MCAPGASLKLVAAAALLLLVACNRSPETAASPAANADGAQPAATNATPVENQADRALAAAQAQAAQAWEPSALDELLAPIALYPDALVGQVLAASANAQEVLDAGNWLLDNQNLQGKELDAAAGKLGFSPAVRSLVQFPSVLDMMCSQLDWTKEVGQAYTADQRGVLDSIQRLRSQAAAVGNLKSTPQQKVEKTQDEGKEVIVVQPADPKVVYVPQYNPQVVYTTPPPPPAPATTTIVQEDNTGDMIAAGLIGFTAGIILNEAFDDHDDYYPHWGGGAVYYPPPYRPVYPGYRPAGAYARPANYRYDYNRVYNDARRGNVNVNIDNDNYFNRVTNNSRAVNRNVNAKQYPGNTGYAGAQDRAGANEYRGARDTAEQRAARDTTGQRAAAGEYKGARDTAEQRAAAGEYKGARDTAEQRAAAGEYKGARDTAEQRAVAGEYKGARDTAEQRATAGEYKGAQERRDSTSGTTPDNAERRAANEAGTGMHQPRADRGFEPSGANKSVARENSQSPGALSNVSRGGTERAASQRGHQSAGNRASSSYLAGVAATSASSPCSVSTIRCPLASITCP